MRVRSSWLRGKALVPLTGLLFLVSCDEHIQVEERNRIARAYADVLFFQAKYPTDSVRQHKAVDSILRLHDFDDLNELKGAVSTVSLQPDDFRTLLDSTQRYLEARGQEKRTDSI